MFSRREPADLTLENLDARLRAVEELLAPSSGSNSAPFSEPIARRPVTLEAALASLGRAIRGETERDATLESSSEK